MRQFRCSTRWLTTCLRRYIFNLMVDDAVMNDVFHALAHDARRAMLARLASGDLTVGELAEPFPMSLEAASKHIKVLERARLVRRTVEGRRHICTLSPAPLASAYSWLGFYERFWNARLDALEGLLALGSKMKGKKRWTGQKR
jgi:DNA-binding transcriptional ArsR family regulator